MTPVERIIMRFYGANTFMFDHGDERHYINSAKKEVLSNIKAAIMKEQSIDLSEEQIKAKYSYLRDIFVKADNAIELKKNLTYLQKVVYQRMYFLKPFICPRRTKNSTTLGGKYEVESNMKTTQTASNASNEQIKEYLNNSRRNIPNDFVNILCQKIEAYEDLCTQRMIFDVTLKAIRVFRESLLNEQ